MRRAASVAASCVGLALAPASHAEAAPHRLHAELDPLPFVLGGYGGQIGYRAAALPRLRFAVASFALDLPDAIAQLDADNDGFHVRVRPSAAVYVLYFVSGERGGWVAGGAVRALRLEYTRDGEPDARARVTELSPEAIVGYKWHPWRAGFYLQPWLGLSRALVSSADPVVGDREYQVPIVQPFFTVNVGWELAL